MILKHRIYHFTNGKVTKTIIICGILGVAYLGFVLNKPIDWSFDRFLLLALAYGFRRAI